MTKNFLPERERKKILVFFLMWNTIWLFERRDGRNFQKQRITQKTSNLFELQRAEILSKQTLWQEELLIDSLSNGFFREMKKSKIKTFDKLLIFSRKWGTIFGCLSSFVFSAGNTFNSDFTSPNPTATLCHFPINNT